MNKEDIIRQFYLDVPRLQLILDNEKNVSDPDYVKKYLLERLSDKESLIVMHTLTQTFLATYYINEFKKIFNGNSMQNLLDSKNYTVIVDTCKKHVQIKKEFKVVDLYEDNTYIADFCNLDIDLYLSDMTIYYSWSYEFNDEAVVVEKDEFKAF